MKTLLLLTILAAPPEVDNGFVTTPQCAAGLAFPTSPLTLYYDASIHTMPDDWWNGGPLGDELGIVLYPFNTPVPEEYIVIPNGIVVMAAPSPTHPGSVQYVTVPGDPCSIFAALLTLPGSSMPDQETRKKRLIGESMGLAPDWKRSSIMDYRVTDTDTGADITAADVNRIAERVVQ